MALQVHCPGCRVLVQVAESVIGQRVRCGRCKTEIPVSRPTSPPTGTAQAPRVTMSCPKCDLVLQVRSADAVRSIQCPRCQTTFSRSVAPNQAKPTAAPQATPAPTAVKHPEPVAVPSPRAGHGRKFALLIGAGAAFGFLVLCGGLIGVVAGARYFLAPQAAETRLSTNSPTPPPVSDLAFIPTDSMALMSIRVADFWNTPMIQTSWAKLPPEAREQSLQAARLLDFDLADFERATVVFQDPLRNEFWAVLKTTRPYDRARREKLLGKAQVQWEDRTHRSLQYVLGTATLPDGPEDPLAVYMASDHVFVVGPEAGVRVALDRFLDGLRLDGPLADLRSRIDTERHTLLVGGRMTVEGRQALDQAAGALPPQLQPLTEVEFAQLAVDFDSKLALEFRSTFPDAIRADRASQLLNGLLDALRQTLNAGGGAGLGGQEQAVLAQLAAALASVTVRADGASIVGQAQIDLTPLVPAMEELVRGMTVQQGRDRSAENNLKQLVNALRAYHAVHGHYPPAVVYDRTGRIPLYSWRVAILPYLGDAEQKLYREFDLTQPWNSPENFKLLQRIPRIFEHPGLPPGTSMGQTCFQMLTGPTAAFDGPRTVADKDVSDGLSKTLLLVERQQFVPWTAPEDARVPEDAAAVARDFLPQLGVLGGIVDTFPAALFDGSVRQLKRSMKPEDFLHAVNPKDGKGLPADR